jgi:hypothetical protein
MRIRLGYTPSALSHAAGDHRIAAEDARPKISRLFLAINAFAALVTFLCLD